MNDERLEAAIRESFAAAAPLATPQRLRTTVTAIPVRHARSSTLSAMPAWAPASILLAAAVLAILAILAGWRPWLVLPHVAAPNPLAVRSDFGVASAGEIALQVDGRRVIVPATAEAGLLEATLAGSDGVGQLLLRWRTDGVSYVLLVHLVADSRGWWVSDAMATTGDPADGWTYFEGPWLEAPHGSSLEGSVHVGAADSADSPGGPAGSLDVTDLAIQPPAGLVATDLAAVGGVVPMRVDGQVVGYVSPHWRAQVATVGLMSQAPDQPVFAADQRRIVGWAQAGGGFRAALGPQASPR